MAFLTHAFNPENSRFRNFLTYERKWTEAAGSEDSHGRALWALGTVLGRSNNEALRGAAGRLFEAAVPAAIAFTSPRAWAFALLGIQEYLDRFSGRSRCATREIEYWQPDCSNIMRSNQSPEWHWFEDVAGLFQCQTATSGLDRWPAQFR